MPHQQSSPAAGLDDRITSAGSLKVGAETVRVELAVLHWNVWYRQDIRELVTFLRDIDADVLCLSELTVAHPLQHGINGPAWLAEQLGMTVEAIRLRLEPGDDPPSLANAILTRHPILSSRRVFVNEPDGSGGYQDEYRGYIEVTIDLGGRHVNIGTTHLSYAHAFEDTARKLAEAERFANTVSDRQTIVTGDFNTTPGSAVDKLLTRHLRPVGPAHHTWTTKPFSYDGFEEHELRWSLDRVLATPDIPDGTVDVLDTELSDHLPLLARFDL